MKIPFKSAAKIAFKDLKQNSTSIQSLSHSQFLEKFALWCGYSSYYQVSKEITSQPSHKKQTAGESLLCKIIENNQKVLVPSNPGTGCTYLRWFLIEAALSQGFKVRVIDCAKLYSKYNKTLGCATTETTMWFSENKFCVYDISENNRFSLEEIFTRTEKETIYFVEDFWKITQKVKDDQLSKWINGSKACFVFAQEQDFTSHIATKNLLTTGIKPMEVVPHELVKWQYTFNKKDNELGDYAISMRFKTLSEGIKSIS